MLQGSAGINQRATALRREMSLPEVLLWQALRRRPAGLKFRRQHPSGPYVADFYCHQAKLIVEIDGEAHERGDRQARDASRDRWFAERGLTVIRYPACDVLNDLDAVVIDLANMAQSRSGED
ncbi:endonuclease domain-containing protein [Sphingomonas sp. FW199]|uniref:endonuclease domain-containing protein n=1 Tax=Sphingomonas sp. FW199 TaxID=3400217 RepID=UPI003CFBB5E2